MQIKPHFPSFNISQIAVKTNMATSTLLVNSTSAESANVKSKPSFLAHLKVTAAKPLKARDSIKHLAKAKIPFGPA